MPQLSTAGRVYYTLYHITVPIRFVCIKYEIIVSTEVLCIKKIILTLKNINS